MRSMPVLLWLAMAWAASRYYSIIIIPSTHISVVVWYQLPILDGRAKMKRDGEQVSKVDIVRARKVGRMGDRQGGR